MKMKSLTILGVALVLLFSSCQPRQVNDQREIAQTNTFEASPTAAKTPTNAAVVALTEDINLSTESVVDLPSVLYVQSGGLQITRSNDSEWIPTNLITIERVFDAIRIEDWVYVLSTAGFQRVDLDNGSVEVLLPLEQEFLFAGRLASGADLPYVVVSIWKSEPPDRKGELYLYDVQANSIEPLLSQLPFPYPLGLTTELVFFLNVHGDPPFTSVESITIRDRTVHSIDVGNNWVFAALSPDGQYMVTQGYQDPPELGESLIKGLRLFEFGGGSENTWIDLPNPPSEVTGFLWSADSRSVYFYLQRAPNDLFEAGFGVWELGRQKRSRS